MNAAPSKDDLIKEYRYELRQIRDEYRIHQLKQIELGHNFALLTVKSLILINAGAITLFPTFIKNINFLEIDHSYFIRTLFLFSISLITALITALLAYGANSYGAEEERLKSQIAQNAYLENKDQKHKEDVKIQSENARQYGDKFEWYSYAAISSSLISFITAIIFALFTLKVFF